METLTIRDLDDAVVERLKEQARHHQRSLEGEVRWILQTAVPKYQSWAEAMQAADAFRARFPTREGSVVDDIHEAQEERDARW